MIVPLAMTIWFSLQRYNLLDPGNDAASSGFDNYTLLPDRPGLLAGDRQHAASWSAACSSSPSSAASLIALLLDQPIFGRGIVRLMVIAPFFVMPTVAALVWKNMLMHPVSGIFAWHRQARSGCSRSTGSPHARCSSIIIIVAWQWLPFATLILLTALQSLDEEQKEAAEMDGTPPLSLLLLHHRCRIWRAPITVVILIETIFLLNVFAEIFVTDQRRPGSRRQPAFLVYPRRCSTTTSAAPRPAASSRSILANIVAFFLVRMIGKNLEA